MFTYLNQYIQKIHIPGQKRNQAVTLGKSLLKSTGEEGAEKRTTFTTHNTIPDKVEEV